MLEVTNPRHQSICKLLSHMDDELLAQTGCLFGGGTAISLMLSEFRTSVDVDFLCSDTAGYAKLRERIYDQGVAGLFKTGMAPAQLREARLDRDGIRTILVMDETPIKFEIVLEGRILLDVNTGQEGKLLPVPALSRTSLFAEKLLANADRGMDKLSLSKDIIDLMVMESAWGEDPNARLIAESAYGETIARSYERSIDLLARDAAHRELCFREIELGDNARSLIMGRLFPSEYPVPPG